MGCGTSTNAVPSRLDVGPDQANKPLGMSLSAISKFIEDYPKVKSESLTTTQIKDMYIRGQCRKSGTPYINRYYGREDPSGEPYVGRATIFVSHAWQYSFYDVVFDVMQQHAEKNPDAYFWFDLFTNNQDNLEEKSFDWFSSTFQSKIRDIGQVLLILSPWNDPVPLTRAWCLFEIFNALHTTEKLHIQMPVRERQTLKTAVVLDRKCLIQALSKIRIENATARYDSDKKLILEVVENAEGGLYAVSKKVKDHLRTWYTDQLCRLVDQTPAPYELKLATTEILHEFGFLNQALAYAKHCCESEEGVTNHTAQFTAGKIHVTKGLLDQALTHYNQALEIQAKDHQDPTWDTALVHLSKGEVHYLQFEVGEAVIDYLRATMIGLKVCKTQGHTGQTPSSTLEWISEPLKAITRLHTDFNLFIETGYMGIFWTAAALLASTLFGGIFKALLTSHFEKIAKMVGEHHPHLADLHHSKAILHSAMSEHNEALVFYTESLNMKLETIGEDHLDIAEIYEGIGNAHLARGEYEKALKCHEESLQIRRLNLGDDSCAEASSYDNIAMVHQSQGEYQLATEFIYKSLKIRETVFGEDHHLVGLSYYRLAIANESMGNIVEAEENQYKFKNIIQVFAERMRAIDFTEISDVTLQIMGE